MLKLRSAGFGPLRRHIFTLCQSVIFEHNTILFIYTLFHSGPLSEAPPVFNNIFATTSVEELWSRRWHQMMKRSVLLPLSSFLLQRICGSVLRFKVMIRC